MIPFPVILRPLKITQFHVASNEKPQGQLKHQMWNALLLSILLTPKVLLGYLQRMIRGRAHIT